MTLPIISADERLKKTKGIKGCIFGKSGIGKTSLLWTLPAEKTLFFDLEAVIRRDKKDVDTGGVDLINLQPAILDRIPNAINPSYVSRILRLTHPASQPAGSANQTGNLGRHTASQPEPAGYANAISRPMA